LRIGLRSTKHDDALDVGQAQRRHADRHVHRVLGEGRAAHLHALVEHHRRAAEELALQVGPL
jgi:hypothetical protein